MLSLGIISFATPWALAAAAALPLVWLLLRLTPPTVRQINFPAIRLLFDLDPTKRSAAHTPPWLLILRIAILTLALLGLADPILNLRQGDNSGPLILVVDNGWASATAWEERGTALREILEAADRRNQPAVLVTTAPTSTMDVQPLQMMPAREVLAQAGQIKPQPWSTDRAATAKRLADLKVDGAAVTWLSDGVDAPGTKELTAALEHFGKLTVIESDPVISPLVQYPPARTFGSGSAKNAVAGTTNGINLKLARVATSASPQIAHTVRAVDGEGQVLARTIVSIGAGDDIGEATMAVPSELANRITRFDVEGVNSAATTVLADDHWQRRPVGIASAGATGITAPLLEDSYYLHEALAPFADARSGALDELLSRPLAVLVMAGGGKILDAELGRVSAWVDSGGVLVRFAGPRLDGNVDSLLPVRLRSGGRTFGGAMSWNTPAPLAPFPDSSPFKGMVIPEDVTVSSQVLAEPSPDLMAKTWARLDDGTPLVTAERRGQGWIVLFHVTATPEWSKLPLSGLFVDMLRRIVDVSQGVPADGMEEISGALAPHAVLDGQGRLSPAGPTVIAVAAQDFATAKATPETPPGLYGPPGATRALNLAANLPPLEALDDLPLGTARLTLSGMSREHAFKPWLLSLALILLLADLAISFVLRRLTPQTLPFVRVAIIALVALTGAHRSEAADAVSTQAEIDPTVRAAVLDTRLAYVATGAPDIDRLSAAGLEALTKLLATRTADELAQPIRIDLTAPSLTPDTLIAYPVLYWRVTASQAAPPARALSAINNYLHRGGMVIFDAPGQPGALGGGSDGAIKERLETILGGLDIPPMMPLNEEHVLNHSFYLMHGLPGRYADGGVLVERNSTANDGVSSVIIGGNDWAGAWAKDANGVPMYATVPGGEAQREQAFRAGVNLVMYALTGNYKSDQVHLPAIMQRLKQ